MLLPAENCHLKFFLLLLFGLFLTGQVQQVFAQPAASVATAEATPQLLAVVKHAHDENTSKLRSAVARGNLKHLYFQFDQELPVVTIDADVQVIYQAPKFNVHLQYATRLEESRDKSLDRDTLGWSDSGLAEQTLIFDGNTITTVEISKDGTSHGDIYFNFHKTTMLRQAGLPFENPILLSEEALRIDRADLQNAVTTRLSAGGFVGTLTKETYRLKFYFFGDFDYDLRRVSSYRIGADVPFRDWHLNWQSSAGVYFTRRIVSRLDEGAADADGPLSAYKTRRQIEVEYKSFDANVTIEPDVFKLEALELPEQTVFYDHRANVNGKPKVMRWNGGTLEPDIAER